jgi:CHAT domain-containing protein
VAAALRTFNKIIFVPHGSLHLLPFQLLPFDGQPLGLSHALSYLPSAGALQFLEPVSSLAKARILAIGNPTGDLPAAAVEALLVAKQFGSEADALIGAAATEAAVREHLPNVELLHLATHGNLSEDAPLQSSLSLADNQFLTLQELMGMQLKAGLVVLSACDTARGVQTGGDDVLGLTRGLIAGGAQSAVVSLWPVNDVSTALLMGHFYKKLKAGATPAEALRLAQGYLFNLDEAQQSSALQDLEMAVEDTTARSLIAKSRTARELHGLVIDEAPEAADYRHPYYWAGFVVVGW